MTSTRENDVTVLDAVIVGAGFSGLYMLHKLRDQMGMNVRIIEAADDVGGTWYWNRYPGARCDSESFYYCYSFSKELEQEWQWTSKYPEQPEILRYLSHVADRFDLRRSINFGERVEQADFDATTNQWELRTDTGARWQANFFISAAGCLSTTNLPPIPGLHSFAGERYHTGQWPHEGVDFTGKRVGLIGTGSTGIQATPVIAAQAESLTVFQRTPNFTVPARNAEMTPEFQAQVKENYAEIRQIARDSAAGFPYVPEERSAFDVDDEERERIYRELWSHGGFKFLWGSFSDLTKDRASNDTAANFIRARIREQVKDPVTAEKLVPTDHPYATKRPPIDTNYYDTYNRDNVSLVDLRADPIEQIAPSGIQTSEAFHELDILVFATGFDAMTGALLKMNIHGVDGQPLSAAWADGPTAYLGLQVAGFPNLFTITGPGSPSVLTNMPVAIEQHVEWVAECIGWLRETGQTRIEATPEAQQSWADHVTEVADDTLYPEANSWYVGANIPGKKRVFMPYVAGLDVYRQRSDEIARNGYEGFAVST